jgi:hypothetical protein
VSQSVCSNRVFRSFRTVPTGSLHFPIVFRLRVRSATRERDRVWGHSASYPTVTMGIKRHERQAASSAEVKDGAMPPCPPYALTAWRLVNSAEGQPVPVARTGDATPDNTKKRVSKPGSVSVVRLLCAESSCSCGTRLSRRRFATRGREESPFSDTAKICPRA